MKSTFSTDIAIESFLFKFDYFFKSTYLKKCLYFTFTEEKKRNVEKYRLSQGCSLILLHAVILTIITIGDENVLFCGIFSAESRPFFITSFLQPRR